MVKLYPKLIDISQVSSRMKRHSAKLLINITKSETIISKAFKVILLRMGLIKYQRLRWKSLIMI